MNTLLNKYVFFLDKFFKTILSVILFAAVFFGYFLKDITFDTNWKIWYTKETLKQYDAFVDMFSYDDAIIIAFEDPKGVLGAGALQTIDRLSSGLEKISYIRKVDSLTTAKRVYSKDDSLFVDNIVNTSEEINTAKIKQHIRQDTSLIGRIVNDDFTATMIIAHIGSEVNRLTIDISHEMMQKVYALIEQEKQYNDYRFYIHGGPEITMAFERLAQHDIAVFVPLIFISMAALLFILFRNPLTVIVALSVVVLTIVLTLGIETLLGHPLNNFTANIPLFIIAIALADTIHMFSAYRNLYDPNNDRTASVTRLLSINIKPLFLTSLTTAIGFYSLIFSPIEPVKLLGESIAVSVAVAFVLALTLVPIYLLKTKHRDINMRHNGAALEGKKLVLFIDRYHKHIIGVFGIVIVIALYGIGSLKIDSNLIRFFDEDVDIRKSLSFIQKKITGPVTYEIVIDTQQAEGVKDPKFLMTLDRFTSEAKQQFGRIRGIQSVVDIVKSLNKAFHENQKRFEQIPDSRPEIAQYLLAYAFALDRGDSLQELISFDERYARVTLYVDLMGTKKDLEILHWIEDWWRNTPYPAQSSGSYALFAKMQNSISKTLIFSLMATGLLVFFVLLIVYRNLKSALLYLVPNVLPILFAFGVMGWLDISIDLGIALSFAIVLSIAIDDTLHFLLKFYHAKSKKKDVSDALRYAFNYAGRGIVFTTIVVSFSFGLFILSDFTPNKDFGIVTSLALVAALLLDLLLLPSILILRYKEKS